MSNKIFAVLASLAMAMAIFIAVAVANPVMQIQTTQTVQNMVAAAPIDIAAVPLLMTSAAPNDIGVAGIIQNISWSNTSQSAQFDPATLSARPDSMCVIDETSGDIQANQINACSMMSAAYDDYMMINLGASGARTSWMAIQSEDSAANPRTVLKCPIFAERSDDAASLNIVANSHPTLRIGVRPWAARMILRAA
jgi:hypothetical protein